MSNNNRVKAAGFLQRLGKDQTGNMVAFTAAAILPLIGLIGGAVDMSRIYAVKSRMQSACDAGALSGRRVMGSGGWNTASNEAAEKMFSTNFADTFFGITGATKSFTGSDGKVTGTVSANVPMTLMRLFSYTELPVQVTCTSEMKIPHTDVMFVLDTTGSMNCSPSDTPATCSNNNGVEKSDARIIGLRKAVNCFYEALAKADTGQICDPQSNGQDAPAVGLAAGIQLRVGFVPYSSNVQVGKLLPTSYMADSWTYQSREPLMEQARVWSLTGVNSTGTYDAYDPATRPTTYTSTTSYGTFSPISGSGNVSINVTGGSTITLAKTTSDTSSTNCSNNNTMNGGQLRAVGDTEGSESTATGSWQAPDYPDANRLRTNTKSKTNTVTGYRYIYSGGVCRLNSASGKTNNPDTRWTQTKDATDRQGLSWSTTPRLIGWTLKPVTATISGLKNGTNWNSSVSVANMSYTTQSNVNLSGTNGTSIYIPASATMSWTGCIEERQTYQNTDTNPDDDWDPIPDSAFDMDIDSAPSATDGTKWGPALQGMIYSRSDSNGRTMNWVTSSNVTATSGKLNQLTCPTVAKKLQSWTASNNNRDGSAVKTYTDSLDANGSTYHDIGLLWGARLISPTGIFGTDNTTDSSGNRISIQRHIVFMTDGDTGTCSSAYTPYGTSWWDRRQTNKNDPSDDNEPGMSCGNSYTNRIVDARTVALCNAIKNKNITLWVVSFGSGVNTTTETRLANCASSANHYYDADSTDDLLDAFKEIAAQISRLRLQS